MARAVWAREDRRMIVAVVAIVVLIVASDLVELTVARRALGRRRPPVLPGR